MELFLFIEYLGIASASLSGYLFAVRAKCDWLGVFIAAFLTSLGGGVMRDVLVGREIYSFTHYMPFIIVLAVLALSYYLGAHAKRSELERRFIFVLADAIDFVCFSIVGAMVALEYGFNIFGVAMVAFCNGVGGGILRDVLLNEVPWFLNTGLYGTISIGVGLAYFCFSYFGFSGIGVVLFLLFAGVIFRMLAFYLKWSLPKMRVDDEKI